MIAIPFLAEWTLRSSILILSGALLLWALRVKDPSIRLAAWTAVLFGSCAIPVLTAALPKAPWAVMPAASRPIAAPATIADATLEPALAVPSMGSPTSHGAGDSATRFDWAKAALTVYLVVALTLLLRLCFGLALSLHILRRGRATGRATHGIEIRESDRVATPVTLGIVRPAIVLPIDWSGWDGAKLDAVLAHERSHVLRRDPAVQLLSAIHRVLLWHSPLSWFLHQRIVRVAEEASDDAAVAVTRDRTFYAEVLMGFMRRGVRGPGWQGVPMARYGLADDRIQRILDGTASSCGVTWKGVAAILLLGSPLAYLAAAGQLQTAPTPAVQLPAAAEEPPAAPLKVRSQAATAQPAPPRVTHKPASVNLYGIGAVSAYTVTVTPQVDGRLTSITFKEGGEVQAGQVLATIDDRSYELQLAQANALMERDEAQLSEAKTEAERLRRTAASNAIPDEPFAKQKLLVAQLESGLQADVANVQKAKLQLSYGRVTSPITGVAGLRLVDPGNMVHAADSIVVINQLQPISVLFAIPEDTLPEVRARLREGANPVVEAWTRDNSARIATGRLTAVDNQIDAQTGTAKLKASFENKDGALFPNEFVNVHLLLNPR